MLNTVTTWDRPPRTRNRLMAAKESVAAVDWLFCQSQRRRRHLPVTKSQRDGSRMAARGAHIADIARDRVS